MSTPISLGSDRYQITWGDWWKYSLNGQDCKKRLMNLVLDINEMLVIVESGQYDNRDIFDCIEEINDRADLCNSAISCYSAVSSDSEIQQLQKDLDIKITRLYQLKSRESLLLSTFEKLGAVFGLSIATGFEKGRKLAVLNSKEPASVEELLETENEKRKLLGQEGQITLCKKKATITTDDIEKQKGNVDSLKQLLIDAENQLAEAEKQEGKTFGDLIDETSIGVTITGTPKISVKLKDALPYVESHLDVYKLGCQRNKIQVQLAQEQIKLNTLIKKFDIQENGNKGFWVSIGNFFFGAKKDGSGISVGIGGTVNF